MLFAVVLQLWEGGAGVTDLFQIGRKLWTLAQKRTPVWDACLTFQEHTHRHTRTHPSPSITPGALEKNRCLTEYAQAL